MVYHPSAQCPTWIAFLQSIQDTESEIEYLQRAIGYSLSGDVREQCLFLLQGVGANGKTTLLLVLSFILGGYACNLPFSAFEQVGRLSIPNDVAMIASKRLVTAAETSESAQLNEARTKALTGGDQTTARHLYRNFFTFSPAAKFWLAVNHLPAVADNSDGFWRRIKLISFINNSMVPPLIKS